MPLVLAGLITFIEICQGKLNKILGIRHQCAGLSVNSCTAPIEYSRAAVRCHFKVIILLMDEVILNSISDILLFTAAVFSQSISFKIIVSKARWRILI